MFHAVHDAAVLRDFRRFCCACLTACLPGCSALVHVTLRHMPFRVWCTGLDKCREHVLQGDLQPFYR